MAFNLIPTAYAQDDGCNPGVGGDNGIDLGDCLRLSDSQLVSDVYTDPAFLVNLIVRNLFVFAGLALFLLIIFAGIKFIAGGKKGAEEGAKILGTAVTGFVVMFSAYWIVQIVKLITGADIIL